MNRNVIRQGVIRRLQKKVKAFTEIRLRKMTIEPGMFDASFISPGFRAIAAMLHEQFTINGGTNYVGVRMTHFEEDGRPIDYEVTLQKVSGETPADQNARLRAEVAELQRQLAERPSDL